MSTLPTTQQQRQTLLPAPVLEGQQEDAFYQLDHRQEEYQAAQRAAVEAVEVGRATLNQAVQQGEQLHHAQRLADETQYQLDRAGRILRGMTWTGWMANLVSSGPELPTTPTTGSIRPPGHETSAGGSPPVQRMNRTIHIPADAYEHVPTSAGQAVAQAILNYQANIMVLESCETAEQRDTCRFICQSMHSTAQQLLASFKLSVATTSTTHPSFSSSIPGQQQGDSVPYLRQFEQDLARLYQRQKQAELPPGSQLNNDIVAGSKPASYPTTHNTVSSIAKSPASKSRPLTSPSTSSGSKLDDIRRQQDDHVDQVARSLGELQGLSRSLQMEISTHQGTLEALDDQTDHILEKSRLVTRRADRLIQSKFAWRPTPATFLAHVSIRHVASGRYVAVSLSPPHQQLVLVATFHPETCVFGVWKRQGDIFGWQNQLTRRWVGQSLFGQLTCSSSSFDRREEWEASSDGSHPPGPEHPSLGGGGDEVHDDDTPRRDADELDASLLPAHWACTRLLCASAGWGAGGYLRVQSSTPSSSSSSSSATSAADLAIYIGGYGVEEKRKADLWCIRPYH